MKRVPICLCPSGLSKPKEIALGPDGMRPGFQRMMDLSRVYGDIFGVIDYGTRTVVISSVELLREVLIEKGEAPLGRIPFGNTLLVNPHKLGTSILLYCT